MILDLFRAKHTTFQVFWDVLLHHHEKWSLFISYLSRDFRGPPIANVKLLQVMSSPQPVLQQQWSASTLLAGINYMNNDAMKSVKMELPDDPEELAQLFQVGFGFAMV